MKVRRLHIFLVVLVFALTIYNILPTLIYYAKPLKSKVDQTQAESIISQISQRVAEVEKENLDWIAAFCNLHNIKPQKVFIDPKDTSRICVEFANLQNAKIFEEHLPKAGQMIASKTEQLALLKRLKNSVYVQRQIGMNVDVDFFKYVEKGTKEYESLVYERVSRIVNALSEQSGLKGTVQVVSQNPNLHDKVVQLAIDFNRIVSVYGKSSVSKRFLSVMQSHYGPGLPQILLAAFEGQLSDIKAYIKKAESESNVQILNIMQRRVCILEEASEFVKSNASEFEKMLPSIELSSIKQLLSESQKSDDKQTVELGFNDVFVKEIVVDWEKERVNFHLHEDLIAKDEDVNKQLVMHHFAKLSEMLGEEVVSNPQGEYGIDLHKLKDSHAFLMLNLQKIAALKSAQVEKMVEEFFTPKVIKKEDIRFITPILVPEEQSGMKKSSIYILIQDGMELVEKMQRNPRGKIGKGLLSDLKQLSSLLGSRDSVISYAGSAFALDKRYHRCYVFEIDGVYQNLIDATKEEFRPLFSDQYATLELSNLEQRLETINRIDTSAHEGLLRWRDDYKAAQVDLDRNTKAYLPKPTKSPLWANLFLSAKKYFRGDTRKVLQWGLDLQGGKSIQIELVDQRGRAITGEEEVKQAISELYMRVNRLGVSEVVIRKEGNKVVLDFPGSQALSAQDLIKGSSMAFHLLNEKFSTSSPEYGLEVEHFLQEVWSEAVVSGKKDLKSVREIACRHLGENGGEGLTESARVLKKAGLQLAKVEDMPKSSFNDAVSQIGILREDAAAKREDKTHPLLILFHNFALEGSQLDSVQSGYSAMDGNYLGFTVKGSHVSKTGEKTFPREELYNWTSHFSKDGVSGTALGAYTKNKGWRMAIVLNERVVSAPQLDGSLRSQGQITGNFTQRELHKLETDLKAGSLSFIPKILSEVNISAQLGAKERTRGVAATIFALIGVVITMVAYYRFSGVIASLAVIFNLLIIWAVYQNIGAALSLSGIAGVILTLGMAVDANVLVFERIREEFQKSNNLASAVAAGYKKAFTAILDSNITTMLAALILLQFDSGPIKGFAVAIIVGIASSMFTALFATRAFFVKWAEKEGRNKLSMMKVFIATKVNFLNHSKKVMTLSALIVLFGLGTFLAQRGALFGMDFTGGYAMTVQLKEETAGSRTAVEDALRNKGVKTTDFDIRTLGNNQLRIYLSSVLDLEGQPFYNFKLDKDAKINWVIASLMEAKVPLKKKNIDFMKQSFVQISGQLSNAMKFQALIGIAVALISILLYISFRFESKFALCAIICLVHDVFVVFSIISIGKFFGLSLQIDLNTIAAIMTIVGYSLNDTIIIFDRLREDLKIHPNHSLAEAVNGVLQSTLSRTMMTSFTTLVVLLILTGFGGPTIFGFAFVMTVGVIFGTLSSLFLAGPALLFFERKSSVAKQT